MKLYQLIKNFSRKKLEEKLIYLERYVNDTKEKFEDYSEVSIKYSPQLGYINFPLPLIFFNKSDVIIECDNPNKELQDYIFKNNTVMFCCHPESKNDIRFNKTILVVPTSSTRTVLTCEFKNNFFIKTDLNRIHYRFNRSLSGSSVKFSLEINNELKNFCNKNINTNFCFLPESVGIIYKNNTKEHGLIFREFNPYPNQQEVKQLIPFFSLYSRDINNPSDLPLLIQLIKNHNPEDKLSFFLESFIKPIIKSWLDVLFHTGLLLEMHGQNTLIEIDKQGNLHRIVYRDFQSVYFDSKIRQQNNLKKLSKHSIGELKDVKSSKSEYSYVYDWMIGIFLFKRLIKVFTHQYPKYSENSVSEKIKIIFNEIAQNRTDNLFPRMSIGFPYKENHTGVTQSGFEKSPKYR